MEGMGKPGYGRQRIRYRNDCQPDCASGGVHYTPAELYASVPKRCPNGRLQYTHVAIAATRDLAKVASVVGGTYSLPCADSKAADMGATRIDSGP